MQVIDLDGDDEEPPTLRIEQSLATIGAKVGVAYAKPKKPKTKTSKRKGPLHRAAIAALREWTTCCRARTASRAGPKSARDLREDLLWAGLPTERDGRPFEFKDLRATFATSLEEAGVDVRIIKRLMGHRPVGVTETHYTKREMRAMAAAVELIEIEWEAGLPPFRPTGDDAGKAARQAIRDRCGRGVAVTEGSAGDLAIESCTVQPTVRVCTAMTEIPYDSRSHLRDLNPRPTVYERTDPDLITVDGVEETSTRWLPIPRRAAVRWNAAVAR
jgi:hypothetical protein